MEGISFVIRVRDEESTLEGCLQSLKILKIPYEVIVILNTCTDGSRGIAERLKLEGMPIKIYDYNVTLSRAGYETLVTDVTSEHSMAYYSKWCFDKATKCWKFRWDADFIMKPALADYLNNTYWGPSSPTRICIFTDPPKGLGEYYLFTGPLVYSKYLFWEVSGIDAQHKSITLGNDIYIDHSSDLKLIKSYWNEPKWFMSETSKEAIVTRNRYEFLSRTCGEEVIGHARSGNPISGEIEGKVYAAQSILEANGIRFWS